MIELCLKLVVCIGLTVFIFSCEDNSNSYKDTDQRIHSPKEILDKGTDVDEDVYIYKELSIDTLVTISRKETPYKGNIVRKYEWSDRNGLNRLIISKIYNYNDGFGTAELFGYQYIKKDSIWERYWQMNDFVKGMGCDLQTEIKDIQILDVDSNNIAETIMLYTLDGRCDAMGVSTRLLMYVEAQKIAVRGISCQYLMPPEEIATRVFESDIPIKYKRIDEGSFAKDTIFVKYASKFWDDFIKNENNKYEEDMAAFRKKQEAEAKKPTQTYLYFKNAEMQYETDFQKDVLIEAINDMINLGRIQLKAKRYSNYTQKGEYWTIKELIYKYFVPDDSSKTLGDDFFKDVHTSKVKKLLKQYVSELKEN